MVITVFSTEIDNPNPRTALKRTNKREKVAFTSDNTIVTGGMRTIIL